MTTRQAATWLFIVQVSFLPRRCCIPAPLEGFDFKIKSEWTFFFCSWVQISKSVDHQFLADLVDQNIFLCVKKTTVKL